MSIATRITSIEEHITNAYNKLEDIGVDLTNVDKNINNIATQLEQVYEDYPKITATDTQASLNNTKAAKMGIDLKGNTSQNGTPTPTSPIPIQNVSGNNTITITNSDNTESQSLPVNLKSKNLFDYENYTYDKTIYNVYRFIEIKNLKSNTNYTLYNYKDMSESGFPNTFLARAPEYAGISWNYIANNSYVTVNTNDTGKLYLCTHQAATNWSEEKWNTFISYFENAMLVEGTDRTLPYEPYYNYELSKIGTTEDFPFKAVDGDDYYDTLTTEQKNALTYGKWYVHKEFKKWEITSNNVNSIVSSQSSTQATNRATIMKTALGWKTSWDTGICLFNNYSESTSSSTNVTGRFSLTSWNQAIEVYNENFTDLATARSLLLGTIILIKQATPTNTEITETALINQLEAILQAKSYNNQTNISQTNEDLPFILDLEALRGE